MIDINIVSEIMTYFELKIYVYKSLSHVYPNTWNKLCWHYNMGYVWYLISETNLKKIVTEQFYLFINYTLILG